MKSKKIEDYINFLLSEYDLSVYAFTQFVSLINQITNENYSFIFNCNGSKVNVVNFNNFIDNSQKRR